jgi:hypothetical protein
MTDPTLTSVLDGEGTPFEVDGVSLLIRPPTPEEYDDAMNIQALAYRKALALPEIRDLGDEPCSDAERESYEAMIASAEAEFKEAEDGSDRKREAAEMSARLKRALERRTLAEELASDRSTLARDRYLTSRLLCDRTGRKILDPKAKNYVEQWAAIPPRVKDAARSAVWTELGKVRTAPFSLERLLGPKSA